MSGPVKRDLRTARRADTEARLVRAATELFVARGYAATTLTAVADAAGLGHRTVYARFRTKVDLLQRCLDVAIRGDEATSIDERSWVRAATSAPTREERFRIMAAATADLMDRTAGLLQVAVQAEASEPAIAARAQAARQDTRRVLEAFWRGMAADGLLEPGADVDWLAVTGTLLAQAETYLLLVKTVGWDADTYASWLETTWRRLAS